MSRMKLRPSPSTVIAVIALIVALGGTAYAAGAFTGKQKKQVTKIATGVFNRSIAGASVKSALSSGTAERAETAVRAETAARASEATVATRATEVTRATEAATAKKVEQATTAQQVPFADTATQADSVPEATRATNAADAGTLGGLGPASFQRSLEGSCPGISSISSVSTGGAFECTSPVQMFHFLLVDGQESSPDLGNGLTLRIFCRPQLAGIVFVNRGSDPAKFSSFELNERANGVELKDISGPTTFGESQGTSIRQPAPLLEGQYIWSTSRAITTVMLHAFFRDGSCEVGGTVVAALG